MPLYEFECESCGTRFEEFAAVGALAPCSSCGSQNTRRVFLPPGRLKLQLRGKAARESEGRRAEREAQRNQRVAEARKARERRER